MEAKIIEANRFWEKAEDRVWRVAVANNLDAGFECAMELTGFNMDEFLFDLFDYGEFNPTDEDIVVAICEALE